MSHQVTLYQRMYTSAPVGLSGSGYQTIACSQQFLSHDNVPNPSFHYPSQHIPEILGDRAGADLDEEFEILRPLLPVNWAWYFVDDDWAVIHRVGYSGFDDAFRPGNYFAHELLVSRDDLALVDFDIAAILRWVADHSPIQYSAGDGFCRTHMDAYQHFAPKVHQHLSQNEGAPPPEEIDRGNLDSIPPLQVSVDALRKMRGQIDKSFGPSVVDPLVQALGETALEAILTAYLCKSDDRRLVVIAGASSGKNESAMELRLASFLSGLMPYHCRRRMPWSTFDSNVDGQSIVMTNRFLPFQIDRHSMYVVDCTDQQHVLPEQSDVAKKYAQWVRARDFSDMLAVRDLCSSFDLPHETEGIAKVWRLQAIRTEIAKRDPVSADYNLFVEIVSGARERANHQQLLKFGLAILDGWKARNAQADELRDVGLVAIQLVEHSGIDDSDRETRDHFRRSILSVAQQTAISLDVRDVVDFALAAAKSSVFVDDESFLTDLGKTWLKACRQRATWFLADMIKMVDEQSEQFDSPQLSKFAATNSAALADTLCDARPKDELTNDDEELLVDALVLAPATALEQILKRLVAVTRCASTNERRDQMVDRLLAGLLDGGQLSETLLRELVDKAPDFLLRHFDNWSKICGLSNDTKSAADAPASEKDAKKKPGDEEAVPSHDPRWDTVTTAVRDRLAGSQLLVDYCRLRPVRPHWLLDDGIRKFIQANPNPSAASGAEETLSGLSQEGFRKLTLFMEEFGLQLPFQELLLFVLAASDVIDVSCAAEPSSEALRDAVKQSAGTLATEIVSSLLHRALLGQLTESALHQTIERPLRCLFACRGEIDDRWQLFREIGFEVNNRVQAAEAKAKRPAFSWLEPVLPSLIADPVEVSWHNFAFCVAVQTERDVEALVASRTVAAHPDCLDPAQQSDFVRWLDQRGVFGEQIVRPLRDLLISRVTKSEQRDEELTSWFSSTGPRHLIYQKICREGGVGSEIVAEIVRKLQAANDVTNLELLFRLVGPSNPQAQQQIREGVSKLIHGRLNRLAAANEAEQGLPPLPPDSSLAPPQQSANKERPRECDDVVDITRSMDIVKDQLSENDHMQYWGAVVRTFIHWRLDEIWEQGRNLMSHISRLAIQTGQDPQLLWRKLFKKDHFNMEQLVAVMDSLLLDDGRYAPHESVPQFIPLIWTEKMFTLHRPVLSFKSRPKTDREKRFRAIETFLADLVARPEEVVISTVVRARVVAAQWILAKSDPANIATFLLKLAQKTPGRKDSCDTDVAATAFASLLVLAGTESNELREQATALLDKSFWKNLDLVKHVDKSQFTQQLQARLIEFGAAEELANEIAQNVRAKFRKWSPF